MTQVWQAALSIWILQGIPHLCLGRVRLQNNGSFLAQGSCPYKRGFCRLYAWQGAFQPFIHEPPVLAGLMAVIVTREAGVGGEDMSGVMVR